MNDIQAEIRNAQVLIGATITSLIQEAGGEYWGFNVRLKNGQERDVWVNCDPEGNGPGHLEIMPQRNV